MISFLAHQAWLMLDAIARTLTRLFVTRRHLLESIAGRASSDRSAARPFRLLSPDGRVDRHRRCSGARRFGVGARGTGGCALPFAALWIASPAIARWTSRSPAVAGKLSMSHGDARALRLIARRAWRILRDVTVTAADNHLPPDNFQEDPSPGRRPSHVAHEHRIEPFGQSGPRGTSVTFPRAA